MEGIASNDLNYEIWVLLANIEHVIHDRRQTELKEYGTTVEQSGVLHLLMVGKNKALTPASLARLRLVTPQSSSSTVDAMLRRGLVKKVRDLDRANFIRVAITEKGKRVYENAVKSESVSEAISALSQEEKHQLWLILKKLIRRLVGEYEETLYNSWFPKKHHVKEL